MPAKSRPDDPAALVDDLAQAVLDAHDGDAQAAIRALVADTVFLKDELYTASCLLSKGMGRGWKPRFERRDELVLTPFPLSYGPDASPPVP